MLTDKLTHSGRSTVGSLSASSRSIVIIVGLTLAAIQSYGIGPAAEVKAVSQLASAPVTAPDVIWVQLFATGQAEVQTDPGGPLKRRRDRLASDEGEPETLRGAAREITGGILGTVLGHGDSMVGDDAATVEAKAATLLQSDLIKALNNSGLPAKAWTADAATDSGIVLSGQFVSIDEGSQLRRVAIGLGAGQSYLATQVQLHALPSEGAGPFLAFHTEGDSGASPGVLVGGAIGSAVTSAAVGAGVSGARSSRKGTPSDLHDTAQTIAQYLSDYWSKQNWPKGKADD